MDSNAASATDRPLIHGPQGGAHYHFLDHLATVKVSAGTDGQLSVVEFVAPRGFGPPLHRHNQEDELFVILEGELNFSTDGIEQRGEAGTVALLPRMEAHTFQVLSDQARFINVTGSSVSPPVFDQMVSTLGVPTSDPTMPAPMDIDPEEVARVCASLGIDILGPPPPPLE